MKWVDIHNQELLDILTAYSDWFFTTDLEPLEKVCDNPKRHCDTKIDDGCSHKYLLEILNKREEHIGFPEKAFSVDLAREERVPSEHKKKRLEICTTLCSYLGARNQAVNVFYPAGGYMGWHTNWNAHGYNILLSYSKTGNGFFRYKNPLLNRKIVTMDDRPGWSCKVGYFGNKQEHSDIYYHCAGSYEPRITLGFIVPHKEMWEDMIEDISGN